MTDQPNALQGAEHLHHTIHVLQAGLTAIPLSTAIGNLDAWYAQLQQSGIPELQDIARELGNLQSLLSSGSVGLDGAAIGRSLSMLGSQTNQAAAQASPAAQAALHTLGDLLTQAGAGIPA